MLIVIAEPITEKIAPSNAVRSLKCEVVPRAAWPAMQTISMIIVMTIVQRSRLIVRARAANSGMNQAIEARKMAIEIRNFIGLIHGLMPVISRVSTSDATAAMTKPAAKATAVVASRRSRAKSEVTFMRMRRCYESVTSAVPARQVRSTR